MSKALELAKKEKEKEKGFMDQVLVDIPEQYRKHVLPLEQNQRLLNWETKPLPPELEALGVFNYKNATFIKILRPYMTVDGRVKWATDEGPIEMSTKFTTEAGMETCTVVVKTSRGTSDGTIEVNIGGSGVDNTNPIANAQTSALGRALGFQGYGVIGGLGIASYDEVTAATNSRTDKPADDEPNAEETATKPADKPSAGKPAVKPDDKPKTDEAATPPSEAKTVTLVGAKRDQSPQGTKYVLASIDSGGKTSNVYALNETIMDKLMEVPANKQIQVKLGKEKGKTIITAIVA